MRSIAVIIGLIGLATSVPLELPKIKLHQEKSFKGIPSIAITFPNGHEDTLVLSRFYSSDEERKAKTLNCNFFGHLQNDKKACVAVTGCPGQDNLEMTINSKHSGPSNKYILHKDGHVQMVESAFKDSRITSGTLRVPQQGIEPRGENPNFHANGDDEMIDDDELAKEMGFEKACTTGDCSTIPATNFMKIKVGYEDSFRNSFGSVADAETYVNQMMVHVQAGFCHETLGTKVQVERVGDITYHSGYTWKAESDSGSLDGPIKQITAASNADANLWVYLAKDPAFYGTIGLAWVGTLCKPWAGYHASINEKRENVLSTAEVVVHEMGHNCGMLHDFDDSHGGQNGACNGQGFMSYGTAPNQWSTCSKADFLALYNEIVASSSWTWCLPAAPNACGGDDGSTPSPPPPPPPPTSGCGSPQWATDQWCDDENNNADCAWDGGACCNNTFSGWDTYCSVCACLDPAAGPTTAAPTPAPPSTAAPTPPPSGPPTAGDCASIPTFMATDRIVGGSPAASPIPWQVSVRQGTSGGGHFCGGTILDEKTVMCAAHCFNQGQSMSGYYVMAGATNRFATTGQTVAIANGVWNSQMPYNSGTMNNDFVILKLASPLVFNADVQPACLPSADYAPEPGPTCIASGWGTLSSGASSLPTDLQWVGVPLITNAQCSNSYSGITSSMICAGLPEGGKDSCQGDSGGPLVCNENGKAVLTGVVSFGIGCALPNYPGVYSRVTAVLSWIQSNMESGGGSNPPGPPPPTTAAPPPSDGCEVPQWEGDGWCDDGNNNAGCNWDGGDCCGDDVKTTYCTACDCLDPAFGGCEFPGWEGDGWCDDGNNNAGCSWDGGDCCGDVKETYCTDCLCLDPNEPCGVPVWEGDGWCDDNNNFPGCNYDGGDCCGDNVKTTYCNDCECLDPKGLF